MIIHFKLFSQREREREREREWEWENVWAWINFMLWQWYFFHDLGSVIKAWDLGIATMKKGELAKFTCKPKYAYGEAGSLPKIPPNATLIFEVELFGWKGINWIIYA